MRRICKRCHRLRAVNGVGYCPGCANTLDALRRPRRRAPEETPEEGVEESEEELAEASTDPAPPAPQEDRKTLPDTPRATQSEAPATPPASDSPGQPALESGEEGRAARGRLIES